MCIIVTALKKKHVRREEVQESMRINSSGFFMAALRPDGTRDTIRTLDEKEALKFFDENVKDDDKFVMHARIPSRGEKTLDNVHGWESAGILFMHNMTITEVDSMMKRVDWKGTDSEFFFRKIFIPFFRGLGDEAYKDGKFHPDLDNIVKHFAGTSNKFCFTMPDNCVIRYGNWISEPDRKEGDEIAFYASNAGYRVYNAYSASTGWKGGTAANTAGFCSRDDDGFPPDWYDEYPDYYGNCCGGYDGYGGSGRKHGDVEPSQLYWERHGKHNRKGKSKAPAKTAFSGEALLKLAGAKGVCQLALAHLVLENALTCRALYSEVKEEETQIEGILRGMMPGCFAPTVFTALQPLFVDLSDAALNVLTDEDQSDTLNRLKDTVQWFAKAVARVYEEKVVKEYSQYAIYPSEYNVKSGLELAVQKANTVMRIMNVNMDFKAVDSNVFTTGFVLAADGWSMEEFMLEDLLTVEALPQEETIGVVHLLLAAINSDWRLLVDPTLLPPPKTSEGAEAAGTAGDADGTGPDAIDDVEVEDDMTCEM